MKAYDNPPNDSYIPHQVLIRGYIYDENYDPIENAIVILEEFYDFNYSAPINCTYMVTNDNGEFCFLIKNINHYYKLKVFSPKTCANSCYPYLSNFYL